MTKIQVTYFNDLPNFGDMLNEWFLTKVFNLEYEKCADQHTIEHYVLLGSILHCTSSKSIVWGSGLIAENYSVDPNADIRCVRGPLSRKHCNKNVPMGDPALLLPLFFPKGGDAFNGITICPHYADHEETVAIFGNNPSVKIVNMLDPVEKVIQEISQSFVVYSSSLHGLIVADAFGIPNGWIGSPNVIGDGFKFYDYFGSTGRHQIKPYTFSDILLKNVMLSMCPDSKLSELQDNLIATCPFKGLENRKISCH